MIYSIECVLTGETETEWVFEPKDRIGEEHFIWLPKHEYPRMETVTVEYHPGKSKPRVLRSDETFGPIDVSVL